MSDPAVPTGYGLYLLQTLLALGAVCVIAYVVLRWGAKRLYGVGRQGQRLRLVERLPLEPRRSLYLVEVAGRVLLIGSSESGVTLVAEIEREEEGDAPTTTRGDRSPDPG
jgi:flagellar protein FliO/FliZ